MIAYTIGNTKSYNLALKNDSNIKKLGKSDDYIGGIVWKTIKEARDFLKSPKFLQIKWEDSLQRDPNNFSIYGLVIKNWETSTYKLGDQDYLLCDTKLFLLSNIIF